MKLRLLVVGRGASELADFEARFIKRIKAYAEVDVIELAEGRGKQAEQRQQEEARHILRRAGKGFILFDEKGQVLDSRKWSTFLGRLPGNRSLDFVIGGADGVNDEVRQAAAHVWSLSMLTLPHQLARILVLEQLYRAFTIQQGHPYHRA